MREIRTLPETGVPCRRVLAGLAGAGLAAGLAACGSSSPAAVRTDPASRRYGGNLRVGLTGGSSADTLDPHKLVTVIDTSRAQTVYEPLVALDIQARTVQYVLASEISPRGGSLTDWVIRLRPGVTFHDGSPLTADDVLATFRRIINLDAPGKVFMGPVDMSGTRVLDSSTVPLRLRQRQHDPCRTVAQRKVRFVAGHGGRPRQACLGAPRRTEQLVQSAQGQAFRRFTARYAQNAAVVGNHVPITPDRPDTA